MDGGEDVKDSGVGNVSYSAALVMAAEALFSLPGVSVCVKMTTHNSLHTHAHTHIHAQNGF